jgi:hypothetical protein
MADTAFQKQFRTETIMGFEKRESYLSMVTTTEANVNGNEAEFLVADSGGATASTRGINGDIPGRADNNSQITCTIKEYHDVVEKTKFNIESSQGDQRKIMQETTRGVINRTRDNLIHDALSNATTTWGSAAVATITLVTKAKTILANNSATDGTISAVITPAYYGYLMGLDQFVNVDYINDKRFEGRGKDKAFSWYGVDWIVDEKCAGVGTNDAKCYMFNKSAVGSAMHKGSIQTYAEYDARHDKSWCRHSVYLGAKLLQNSGVIVMPHDDSALSA